MSFKRIILSLILISALALVISGCKPEDVPVDSITISAANNATTIFTMGGTLQFTAVVSPENADDPSVVWSVSNGTGEATINVGGLLTAVSNGTVSVKATSVENEEISATKIITISNQEVLVASIEISAAGNVSIIDTFGGTLQFSAVILPANAVDKSIVWSVEDGTGEATISVGGLLTAVANGTVSVKATSSENAEILATKTITISNQEVLAASIELSSVGDASVIDAFGGTLQFSAVVLPANAVDQSMVWSVQNGTGEATISVDGLLTAVANGTVTVKVSVVSEPLIFDSMIITISHQEILVVSITVSGFGGLTTISTVGATLQMSAVVLPANAADQSYVWSVVKGTGEATIDENGLLTAITDGTIDVLATSVTQPLIFGKLTITLSNQTIWPHHIDIASAGHVNVIDVFRGTLQLSATLFPENATDSSIIWSVENGTGQAIIDQNGLLTAAANGIVTVKASATSDAMTYDSMVITISHQEILIGFISVTGFNDATTIATYGGTLQMIATVYPVDALDPSVIWSVQNGSGEATISTTGLLTAVANGTVTVKATANTDLLIFHTMIVNISHQEVYVSSVSVTGFGGAVEISTFGGTLQMIASVLPLNADDPSIIWSLENGTGEATISLTALVTAISNGTVTVKATSIENALIFDTLVITLTHQEVHVTQVLVTSEADAVVIDTFSGTLQMYAEVLPLDATNPIVLWSVENGTGEATISETGLLFGLVNGTVTVIATSQENPLIFGTFEVTLSHQENLGPIDLGLAGEFAILTETGITATVGTLITGNVGVSPIAAASMTGFDLILDTSGAFATSSLVVGMIYAADYAAPTPAYLTEAVTDMHTAYTDAAGRTPDFIDFSAGDISGQTLVPGVYFWSTALLISDDVILSGSASDVWIFQISGALTQAATVQVILTGGAVVQNVVWQVAGAVGIGANAHFEGTILGMIGVNLGAGASLNGKIFAQTALTLDGNIINHGEVINIESITVSSEADAVAIDTFRGTLQMYADVLPLDVTNKAIIWSVESGTGEATISGSGLLSAVVDGTVTVKAASARNPLIFETMEILLSNQTVLVASITLAGDGGSIIDTYQGTLQILETVLPVDAANKTVIWSVEVGTGEATISETGLLSAVVNGTVTVKATSVENALIFGILEITISNQEVPVESILVTSEGDVIIIDVLDGTLQMYAAVLPLDAANPLFTWSVANGTGEATISETGLLTAVANGTVMVKATSDQNPLIFDVLEITMSNQPEVVSYGPVDLGSAADFTILSKTGISATVGTLITGNIGVSPGPASYITGFSLSMDASGEFATSSLVVGMIYASDLATPTPSYLSVAVGDMETAYTDAAGRTPDFTELYAGDISGQVLLPGVYYWSSGLLISSNVTLSGSATDTWIFQIAGTLTQAASVQIILSGGAVAENIVWQVATAVSIGVGAHFEGTILGMTSVNLGTNATMNGKIFAQTAVTLDGNTIN